MTSTTASAPVAFPQLRRVAELTAVLSRKNFRIRYKRAALGVFWAVLQPAFQAVVLSYIFLRVFHVHSVPHYPVYVLSGILPWAFFSGSMTSSTVSVVDNGSLVKKVAMPLVVLPLSAVGGTGLAFLAALPVLVVGAVISGTLGLSVLLLPFAVALEVLTIAGLAILLASLYPAFRDMRYLVESLLLLGLYATPVLYDRHRLSGTLAHVLLVNPMTGVMETYRAAVLGWSLHWDAIGCTVGVDVLLLLIAVTVFRRRSDEFPDLV
jgi:ABC-type polysaccharide/polyol phosphate export permease